MIVPLCTGMQRSASTLTWQIVKCLAPQTRPLNWHPGCEVSGWTGHPLDWPIKRHDYLSGNNPVIYTYRHPVEAFLSLHRCFLTDVGSREEYNGQYAVDNAGRLILESADVFNAYKKDRDNGRPVLFLRYEDYYNNPESRIAHIAAFMLIVPALRENEVNEILEFTDIKRNASRAGKSFHDEVDVETGMQGRHIDTENWGEPGKLLEKYKQFASAVKHDPKLADMKAVCDLMGYNL